MENQTMWQMLQPILMGQLRHGLTLVAGALVTHGIIKSDQSSAFIEIGIAIILYLIGAGYSWYQKIGQAKIKTKLEILSNKVKAIPAISSTILSTQAVNAIAEAKLATK